MKIVQNDEKTFKIQQTSFLGVPILLLMGIIFTLVPTGVIFAVSKTTLNCEKVENNGDRCQLTTDRLLNSETRTFPESIKKADIYVSENYDDDTFDYSYGIVLISETKTIPLRRMYSYNKQETLNRIDRINAFIQDPSRNSLTITIAEDVGFIFYIFLGVFLLVGILITLGALFSDLKTTLLFKKTKRELEIKHLKLFGYFTKKYSFSEIDRFLMETKTEADKETNHTFQMKLKSGQVQSFYKSESRNKVNSLVENYNSSIQ